VSTIGGTDQDVEARLEKVRSTFRAKDTVEAQDNGKGSGSKILNEFQPEVSFTLPI